MDSKKKRESGKRPKKRRFLGNQFVSSNKKSPENDSSFNSDSDVNTFTDSNIPCPNQSSNVESASSKKLSTISNTKSDSECNVNNEHGYLIIDKQLLFSFLEENLHCKLCNGHVKVSDKRCFGLYGKVFVTCDTCKEQRHFKNSKLIGEKQNIPELNRRMVYAMRSIGQGSEPMRTFCGLMDLYPPVTQNAYDKICHHINEASKHVAEKSMKKAGKEEAEETNSRDITVSGDGSWKTRGHTSQIGICAVIGAQTGKVVDVEVLSLTCRGCDTWKGVRSGSPYEEWKKQHSEKCLKNHSGSSGKMEVDGMLRIFNRSESERDVRYVQYIGDGDAKTFLAIQKSKPYGDTPVTKLECITHVQKRMGTRLRKLKQEYKCRKLSDNKSLSGKGRLTDVVINKLTTFYGNAIRQHPDSLQNMRNAVWAVYFHTRSTDQEPLHSFCPIGVESWCKYQQAVAKGTISTFRHKGSLPSAVMDAIKPVFNALSAPELLKRCLGSHTQNPNESFNSTVWSICPKTSGSGKIIAEIATYEAVIGFNDGRKGKLDVMKRLNIYPGANAVISAFQSDSKRVQHANRKKKENTLEVRRAIRRAKLNLSKKNIEEEGLIYEPGGF